MLEFLLWVSAAMVPTLLFFGVVFVIRRSKGEQ